jgi:hypothetical protein
VPRDRTTNLGRGFQKAFVLAAAANMLLVCVGGLVFPTTLTTSGSWLGLVADTTILTVYAAIGWLGMPRTNRLDSRILAAAIPAGGIAGIVFCIEIIAEYVLLPGDNTVFGLVEFGAVFFVFFVAAVWVACRTRRIGFGILASMWSSAIASLVWLGAILTISYLFHGTVRQTYVFQAEGNYDDFARSGQTDFDAFIMQDFMGAGFYHLLLSPIVAGLVGTVGATISRAIARLVRTNRGTRKTRISSSGSRASG